MGIAEDIERLRDYPKEASDAFKDQLSRAQGQAAPTITPTAPRGVDRSNELAPLPRPTIVRSIVEAV
jgi:hypothetical protein